MTTDSWRENVDGRGETIRQSFGIWPSAVRTRTIGKFAIDLVYPKRCAGCGARGSWLCPRCDASVDRFAPPWCSRCGLPTERYRCECHSMPANLERVRSLGPYDGWLRRAVIQFKYHGEWARAEPLGQALAIVAADLVPGDGLVPVALHPSRLRRRGFNQSLLLAKQAALPLSMPVADVLSRTRPTAAQVRLAGDQRAENVRDAFALKPGTNVAGKSLVLIDDVITTGATLGACAAALLDAGATRVSALTLAREI